VEVVQLQDQTPPLVVQVAPTGPVEVVQGQPQVVVVQVAMVPKV
jgi:hypothetical protein